MRYRFGAQHQSTEVVNHAVRRTSGVILVLMLGLAGCASPLSIGSHTNVTTPTATHTPHPTPIATLSSTQTQQGKQAAIAEYMALFQHGIPRALKNIPVSLQDGTRIRVQIGQQFGPSVIGGAPLRTVMPLYAYLVIQGGKPLMRLTFGTYTSGKPATLDLTAPPSYFAIESDTIPPPGSFLLDSSQDEWNGYLADGGGNVSNPTLGLPINASPMQTAAIEAADIAKIGKNMLDAAADPQDGVGAVAAYLMLPQDDPQHEGVTYLSIPPAQVLCFCVSTVGNKN